MPNFDLNPVLIPAEIPLNRNQNDSGLEIFRECTFPRPLKDKIKKNICPRRFSKIAKAKIRFKITVKSFVGKCSFNAGQEVRGVTGRDS